MLLGDSFLEGKSTFCSLRHDFLPASVDTNSHAQLIIEADKVPRCTISSISLSGVSVNGLHGLAPSRRPSVSNSDCLKHKAAKTGRYKSVMHQHPE